MSQSDYNYGRAHGCPTLDTEYGSRAWVDAMRGAYDKRDADAKAFAEAMAPKVESSASRATEGSSSGIAALLAVAAGGWYLVAALQAWKTYPYPYKAVAFFYYCLIDLPLLGFSTIWRRFFDGPSGSFDFLNVLGVIVAESVYFAFVVLGYAVVLELLKRLRISRLWLVAPAAFAGLWYAVAQILK